MSKSIYPEKLHNIEHDVYIVLKDIFSFLSKFVQPILKGLCLTMASFGGLVIMVWFVFLLILPVLLVVALILKFAGF